MSPLPRAQLLKGTTELLVLSVLEAERLHGYEIAQRIRDGVSAGVSEGALYPALHRLERRGALVGSWGDGRGGPRRRYYTLTDSGRGELVQARAEWDRFAAEIGTMTRATREQTSG